jgi:hypothetical protein
MDLGRQAASTLKSWGSFSGESRTLAVTGDRSTIAVEVRAADSLGCSLAEVRLRSLQPLRLGLEQLRSWGARLSKRIRYLLEALETLEVDADAGRLLLRSSPPETKPDGAVLYYELVLEGSGQLLLRRYRFDPGTRERTEEPIVCTIEVVEKMFNDLASAAP